MKKKYSISFQKSLSPITEPVTKFGGQPVWIEKPEWAISKTTGKPMTFICQILLEPEIFGKVESKMAYIFMETENWESQTWDAEFGDNAVIIQPNGKNPNNVQLKEGLTIESEFSVIVTEGEDKEIKEENLAADDFGEDEFSGAEDEKLSENKIGGIPIFLQYPQFPDDNKENWNLLLQLDSCSVPFDINLGDAGVGYAFISKAGKAGKFLWQCA